MTIQQTSTRFAACLAACILAAPASVVAQSAPAAAARPSVTSVAADFSMNPVPVIIAGSAFGSAKPTVTIDLLPAEVVSHTNTRIVANLPTGMAPDSYLVQVTNTTSLAIASFDATLGTAGPAGPIGSAGATGPQGPPGPTEALAPRDPLAPPDRLVPRDPPARLDPQARPAPRAPPALPVRSVRGVRPDPLVPKDFRGTRASQDRLVRKDRKGRKGRLLSPPCSPPASANTLANGRKPVLSAFRSLPATPLPQDTVVRTRASCTW